MEQIKLSSVTRPLRFEHLVQINDPADPRLEMLSRDQLWRGLVQCARHPRLLMPWLEGSEIREQPDGSLERVLDFGTHRVRERLRFDEEECVRCEVMDAEPGSSFRLTMRIEEPVAQQLFVRFIYETHSADHHEESPLSGFIRDAYRQADNDTITGVRMLVATGALQA